MDLQDTQTLKNKLIIVHMMDTVINIFVTE